MRIDVVGSTGRMGGLIVEHLNSVPGVDSQAYAGGAGDVDAVVVAAPLPDVALHAQALRCGAHVVDVTVDRPRIKQLLELDTVALEHGRSLVTMAGLAPGLTGTLGLDLLARCDPTATVQVALMQHPQGAAGRRGTADMLNLLTDPAIAYRRRPYLDCASGRVASRKFFDFPTAEAVMLPGGEDLRIVTTFDGAPLPQLVRMMARLRRVAPPAYARARSLIAQRKANQHGSGNENITLTALAVGSGHQIADYDCLILDSDYGTTAGVAAAAAVAAAQGDLTAGAGHPARFFSLEALLEAPLVTQHVVARRSSAGAPRA